MAEELIRESVTAGAASDLERDFPGLSTAIVGYETSTPLTYRDYTATPQGSLYGIAADCQSTYLSKGCSKAQSLEHPFCV